MTNSRRTRIAIVDDDVVLADALRQLWEADEAISIVGVAHTGKDGIELASREHPDVILMDHHLPDMTGAAASAALSKELPGTPIVMLTRDDSDEALLAALEAGVSGFLLKSTGIREVGEAIHQAAAGEILIPSVTMTRLMVALRGRRQRDAEKDRYLERLSTRELEVLNLMADGFDTRSMCEQLGVGLATIRTHVSAILAKLDAHSRLEAVAMATKLGLIH